MPVCGPVNLHSEGDVTQNQGALPTQAAENTLPRSLHRLIAAAPVTIWTTSGETHAPSTRWHKPVAARHTTGPVASLHDLVDD